MCAQTRRWLKNAGVEVPEGVKVEVSPLYAMDALEMEADADRLPPITKDTYIKWN
jgi:hypothetical protein